MSPRPAVLVHGRGTAWAARLPAWSASLDADLVWCTTGEEVRARLSTSRPFAALLVDERAPGLDRDLLAEARERGTRTLVVANSSVAAARWADLGAMEVLEPTFSLQQLLTALTARPGSPETTGRDLGHVVAVCGSGGTGASTVAVAVAQGGATTKRVVLADLARHGEQAMLHVAGTRIGVEALVERHRTGSMTREEITELVSPIASRGYDLLVGLRRARAWSLLRPRAVDAALRSLREVYDLVVCDIDPDLEGEDDGGSRDVEERNVLARAAVETAAVVVVVAAPGLKGTHSLVRVLAEVWAHGAEPARTVVVVNRVADRSALDVVARALRELLAGAGAESLPAIVALPDSPVEHAFVTGIPLDSTLVVPMQEVVSRSLDRDGPTTGHRPPVRVAPGSLGTWHQLDDD